MAARLNDRGIPRDATGARFAAAVRHFAKSDVGKSAAWLFAGLVAFLFAINGMNVVNSYVGRDFMTAVANRDRAGFVRQAILYVSVFAVSTLLSVTSRYMEERLGLLWRDFLTRRSIDSYMSDGSYYRLEVSRSLANPDQRITEDIRSFTVTTLSFVLMVLNSSFTVVAFSGVLWSISPTLFLVAVAYAAGGSLVAILLGRPLVRLNFDQLDREANFRAGLVHVRENADAILVAGAEPRISEQLKGRLSALVSNFRRIICVNRNLGFFTTGYNWMIQIIPALIVAPVYMDGKVEFGVVTQSAMAFSTLVAAFSLIVTQFQSISSFAAVVERLGLLVEAVAESKRETGSAVEIRQEPDRLAYRDVTLCAPGEDRALIERLSVEIPLNARILVRSEDEGATAALFRATAGLAAEGQGQVIRPGVRDLMFLAERPYLPPVTLRTALMPAGDDARMSDSQLRALLADWDLESAVGRAEGLDREQDWDSLLSLGEQQLLASLHVFLAAPRLVLLDRPCSALGRQRVGHLLTRLAQASIGYVHLGQPAEPETVYSAILDIDAKGRWRWIGSPPTPGPTPQTDAHERRETP